jgi:superfamily I DNA/RNA helicase
MQFYRSDTVPICVGPEGEAPRAYYYEAGTNERLGVEALIDELVGTQDVRPEHIALLTRRSRERGAWSNPPRRRAWSATWELKEAADKVLCATVHGFKGLERPVVIVCELQDVDPEDETELLYVAFSRARTHLIVVGLGAG